MLILAVIMQVVTGAAYLAVAVLCLIDVLRLEGRVRSTIAPFSIALGLIMFTAGAHSLDYAYHLEQYGHVSVAGFWAILMAVPPVVLWAYLRIERLGSNAAGGGDRRVWDHPRWLTLGGPTLVVIGALGVGYGAGRARETANALDVAIWDLEPWWHYTPLLIAAACSGVVAGRLWATARRESKRRGWWSVSGLALAGVFLTLAMVHAVQAFAILRGKFDTAETHLYILGWTVAAAAVAWAILVVRTSGGLRPD